MTSPPPPDNVPDDPEPAAQWAPPDAPEPADEPASPATPDAASATGHDPAPAGTAPGTPPDLHGASPPAVPGRTNRLAIAALVTGLLGLILLAVGFAIAALVQTGRRREKGKGLAVGGLAASVAWAAAAVALAASGVAPFTADDETSGSARSDGYVRITSLKVGDCFTAEIHDSADPFVDPSPCNHPHNGEVTAKVTLPAGAFPAGDLSEQARNACRERVRGKVEQAADEEFEPRPGLPDEETWANGRREVTCTLVYIGDSSLTTNLAGGRITPEATFYTLEKGDCIKKWDESRYDQPLVKCTAKHEYQVLTVYELEDDGRYPGREALEERALDGCARHAVRIWGANPPFDLIDPAVVVPTEHAWRWDGRQVICLVVSKHGALERSVVPH
ncbi:septum formation family protein [Actinomadura welshii]